MGYQTVAHWCCWSRYSGLYHGLRFAGKNRGIEPVGSANFDPRSMFLYIEVSSVINSADEVAIGRGGSKS
jgi:hypothetical protein